MWGWCSRGGGWPSFGPQLPPEPPPSDCSSLCAWTWRCPTTCRQRSTRSRPPSQSMLFRIMSLEKYYLGEKEGYKWSEASFEFFYARLLDFIVEWWPCGELPVLSEGFKDRKYFFGNFHTSGDGGNNKNVEFLDFFSSCFESFLSDSLASKGVHRENCLWRLT